MELTELTKKQKAERFKAIESVTEALEEFDIDINENQISEFVDSYGAEDWDILNFLEYSDIAESYKYFANIH